MADLGPSLSADSRTLFFLRIYSFFFLISPYFLSPVLFFTHPHTTFLTPSSLPSRSSSPYHYVPYLPTLPPLPSSSLSPTLSLSPYSFRHRSLHHPACLLCSRLGEFHQQDCGCERTQFVHLLQARENYSG
jgi:hypothetical protein